MRSNILKLSLIALTLFPLSTVAEDSYNEHIYKYYFVNGMLNSPSEADSSKKKFQDILLYEYKKYQSQGYKDSLKYISSSNFALSYNQNEELMEQALEVYKQKVIDDTYSSGGDLSLHYSWSGFINFLSKTENIFMLSEEDYHKKFFEEKMSNYIYDVYIYDDDLNDHIDNYRRDIKNGYKVVLLAHSQGNFYANFAYDILYQIKGREIHSNSLGIVSVGTPAKRVKNDYNQATAPYTTFYTDIPMLGVRTLFPDTLPSNDKAEPSIISIFDGCGGDDLCHGFVEAYTNILNTSRKTIMTNVINVAEGLDKSQWKQVGEEFTKQSCRHRLKMQNVNTGEGISVYPFNTKDGKIYQVGDKWVMASYGGDLVYSVKNSPEYGENACHALRNTNDLIRKVAPSGCNNVEAYKASNWNLEYINSFNVTLAHKTHGTKIYNVYPFNTNGYIYEAGRDWVIGSCGGEEVYTVTENSEDYVKEYYELAGTDETILISYKPKNPTPTPTPKTSFNCQGDGRDQGFEISATYCSFSDSDDGRFWLRDEGFVYIPSSEKTAYDQNLANQYQYCGVSDKNTINSFGGDSACGVAHVYWDYVGDNSNMNLRTLRKADITSKGKKKEELSIEVINSLDEHNKTLYETNSLF